MIFFYHPHASNFQLSLQGEEFHRLIRVRRKKKGEEIILQNLNDFVPYVYLIENISKRNASLRLLHSKKKEKKGGIGLSHLLWGICDPKTIYSTLPSLFQLGIQNISFVQCDRSQATFIPDLNKIEKIFHSSAEQCGRNILPKIHLCSFSEAHQQYPNALCFDFGYPPSSPQEICTAPAVWIGPEGGFSELEKKEFLSHSIPVRSFFSDTVLKSETACIAIASTVLFSSSI